MSGFRPGFQNPVPLCTIFTILLTLWNSEQKNWLLIKLFCVSFDFDETWWSFSYPYVLQFHQVSSNSDEIKTRFINSPFFCSEFQSVSRIVKIVHSGCGHQPISPRYCGWRIPEIWVSGTHSHYVRFSQFYWHFEILNRKMGY